MSTLGICGYSNPFNFYTNVNTFDVLSYNYNNFINVPILALNMFNKSMYYQMYNSINSYQLNCMGLYNNFLCNIGGLMNQWGTSVGSNALLNTDYNPYGNGTLAATTNTDNGSGQKPEAANNGSGNDNNKPNATNNGNGNGNGNANQTPADQPSGQKLDALG